jgi:hypothetical protein
MAPNLSPKGILKNNLELAIKRAIGEGYRLPQIRNIIITGLRQRSPFTRPSIVLSPDEYPEPTTDTAVSAKTALIAAAAATSPGAITGLSFDEITHICGSIITIIMFDRIKALKDTGFDTAHIRNIVDETINPANPPPPLPATIPPEPISDSALAAKSALIMTINDAQLSGFMTGTEIKRLADEVIMRSSFAGGYRRKTKMRRSAKKRSYRRRTAKNKRT